MCFDLGDSYPVLFGAQHRQNQYFRLKPHVRRLRKRQIIFPMHYPVADLFGVLIREGRVSKQALEHDDPHAPNVDPVVIDLIGQHFRRDVVRGANF